MSKYTPKVNRYKGDSILKSLQNYTVIDIETTGLDPSVDEIIELSALKVRAGKVTKEFTSLVKPNTMPSEFVLALTEIPISELNQAKPIESVIKEYVAFIGDDKLVGHNINFDINFIYDNYLKVTGIPFRNRFVDTLRLSMRALKGIDRYRLGDIARYFKIPVKTAHRGLADCITTYLCYENLKKYISRNNIDVRTTNNHQGFKNVVEITVNSTKDIELNPFYGKDVVFTGTLENFSRNSAMQIIEKLQGINGKSVTKKTSYLVLGNSDYRRASKFKGEKSSKQKKAEELILKGQDLQIISEDVFYDIIGEYIE